VLTVVDREEGAADAFRAAGLALHALYRKSEFATDSV
jgi:orotate phosphoribosyltransferase